MSKPDKQKLLELADRVEALTYPSREVDAEIEKEIYSEFLSKCTVNKDGRYIHPIDGPIAPPQYYTESIDTAVSLVPDGMKRSIIGSGEKPECWVWWASKGSALNGFKSSSKIEACAVVAAALRAIASEL